ncbi:hypothetical protein [Desulfomonile tiedjei]|uniref:Uncharacterized protein n=1 Tax=Desulfomonile tiedjei (strain ATCC 49306 / DSM 6799 / DCB-1) TaxID=706587 RepID=I4BZT9_DESTA|nr:hypothetical protein [Desulfomonile tiedjei]AFM22830.1 hypothetical protein Desti_0081 [Desulfomonile tiedjei DSM 6799]
MKKLTYLGILVCCMMAVTPAHAFLDYFFSGSASRDAIDNSAVGDLRAWWTGNPAYQFNPYYSGNANPQQQQQQQQQQVPQYPQPSMQFYPPQQAPQAAGYPQQFQNPQGVPPQYVQQQMPQQQYMPQPQGYGQQMYPPQGYQQVPQQYQQMAPQGYQGQ